MIISCYNLEFLYYVKWWADIAASVIKRYHLHDFYENIISKLQKKENYLYNKHLIV